MLEFLKNLFKSTPEPDYKALVKAGATILDVRTKGEYSGGHVRGSINIPLQDLASGLNKINKSKPVITCCASGMRSSSAKSLLLRSGFQEVYNGGSWSRLDSLVR